MSHYSKLGVIFVRLAGIVTALTGAMGLIYNIMSRMFLSASSTPMKWSGAYWISSLIYIVGGMLLYFFGKPLGQLVGRGLEA